MKRSTVLLLLLAAAYLVAGILEPLELPRGEIHSPLALIHGLVGAVLIYAWCRAHSQERQTDPPAGAAILCAFVPPIGLPYYMFRSYPWRRAALGLCKALGFFLVLVALFYGSFYAKFHLLA